MKAFQFPLERALRVRRTQFDVEQGRLQKIDQDLARVRDAGVSLQAFGTQTREWIASSEALEAATLATVPDFQRHAKQLVLRLNQQEADLALQKTAQERQALEARRKVKLLEKLREKRHAAWRSGIAREQENFAAESFLGRWSPPH